MLPLAQPPRKDESTFNDWMYRLWQRISRAGGLAWTVIDKTGSNLTDIETRNHADLQNINTANYTHLTAVNHTDLTDSGVTDLHQHDFDHITFPVGNFIGTPSHVYTLSELMDHEWSAGIVDGGLLTDNGNGTISVSAAVSTIRATTDPHGTLYGVVTPEQLNIALTDDATNYLYLNYAGVSTAFAVTTTETIPNGLNKVLSYEIHRNGNVLHYIDQRSQTVDALRKVNDLRAALSRFAHDNTGTALGANGLALTVTAGAFHRRIEALPHAAFNTSVAGMANANVFVLWNHVAGVYTSTELSKVINTTLWDNGTGTATLTNNKFGVSWVYIVNDSPSELHVVMGQAEYLKLSDAEVAVPPTTGPSILTTMGVLIGFVAYEKGVTSFNGIYSAFAQAFTPGLATLHNSLGGIQGGIIGEYYHLTAAEYAAAVNINPSVQFAFAACHG